MNQAAHTQTVQKFALEGPLSVHQLIALGAVLAVIVAILAWRDYKSIASRTLFVLLLLPRLAAIAVILWMLAEPTVMTMARHFTPKSVVVLADGSASMSLADAMDGSGNTAQWNAAKIPALETLDQILGTLSSAQSGVGQLRQAVESGGERKQTQATWDGICDSLKTTSGQLAGIHIDGGAGAELRRASSFLADGLPRLAATQLDGSQQSREDRADELGSFVEGGLRRVKLLAQKVAAQYERSPPAGEKSALAAQSQSSREDKVAAWLGQGEDSWLRDLGKTTQLLRYKFASDILPVPDGDWRGALQQTNLDLHGTDLSVALSQAAQDASQGAVGAAILVTDGGHNASSDPRETAQALRGVPLFIVPIGSTIVPRDVILHHIQCPKAVFQNDMVVLEAMVTAYYCNGEQVRVELTADDQLVDSQTLPVTSDVFDGRVTFRWKGSVLGRHLLKVRTVPVPRELTLDNNMAQTEVEVMEDVIHVLLADDLPRWEFRYLSMLFKRDKHVDFDQLLFEPNDDSQGGGQSFPQDLQGWRKYRVVILGDVSPAELSVAQQELLRKYVVEDGGNLVVVAGESAMPQDFAGQPLGDMIPCTAAAAPNDPNTGFNLVVTAEGSGAIPTQLEDDPLASDRVWRDMSARLPVYNLSAISVPKPTSHVLISAVANDQTRAFLSWQYIGLGRVIYIAAPITYQLRYGIGDLYHHRFWGQLLRWAIAREMAGGAKSVHLLTDKNRYEVGDHAQIVLRLTGSDGTPVAGAQCGVKALRDGKKFKEIEMHEEPDTPGMYRGTLEGLTPGPMTLRATGPTVQSLLASEGYQGNVEQLINVDIKSTTELTDPVCNLPLLNQLADASGGALLPPDAVPNALARLNVTPSEQDNILSRRPLWNRWGLLWIFIGCMTIEWLARRYWRMV